MIYIVEEQEDGTWNICKDGGQRYSHTGIKSKFVAISKAQDLSNGDQVIVNYNDGSSEIV